VTLEGDAHQGVCRIAVEAGSPTYVVMAGEFDIADDQRIVDCFAALPPGDVTLNLREVTFCSSSLLGRLLHLHKRLAAHGYRVRVDGMSPVVTRLLLLTDTLHLFAPIEGDERPTR
jgi:anti-anti-sigma factor